MSKRKKKSKRTESRDGARNDPNTAEAALPAPPEPAPSPPASASDAEVRLAPNEGGETAPEPFTSAD